MLDKTRKIIYIITGTLTIISLVFMLMHKVGLCASSNPTEGAVFDSTLPLPVGVGYGYDSSQIVFDDSFVQGAQAYCNSRLPYESTPDISVIYFSEDNYSSSGYYEFCAISQDGASRPLSFTVYTSSGVPYAFEGPNTYLFRFRWYPDTNTFDNFYYIGYRVWTCYLFGSNNYPFGSSAINNKYAFNKDSFFTSYPIWVDRYDYTDTSGTYTMFQYISDSSGIVLEGGSGEVTTLPNLEDLTGTPSSGDTNDTLFSFLKGWLSTINGNIKKGFTNIYDNITSFLKPYLERFKSVTDIIQNPEDFLFCSQERQQELLQGSQVYQDLQSLQGIGNNIFGVLGASASEHVYWTFDFSGTVLDNCGVVQIDFDWYDSIRSFVVPLFLAFFYVGMLLLIIRKIPGIISGASSNSDDK